MTNPNPPNDPKHWADVAFSQHPTWSDSKLIVLALDEFLGFRNWEIRCVTFLAWEDQLVAMVPDSPCIERATVNQAGTETSRAFILCHECQEALSNEVELWFRSKFLPNHPEWDPPNPAALLAALDETRAAAELAKNPQLKLFEF